MRPPSDDDHDCSRPRRRQALSEGPAGLLTRVLPYVTVVIAALTPLAAALYLLTTVAWTLAERRHTGELHAH